MKFTPHPYQREAIIRIEEHDRYGLFLDMGLGKSVITLTAIADLIYDFVNVSKVLIIAPRTVAESTWQAEAAKWDHLHGLTFSTVLGTQCQRIAALEQDADCYVINRENVVWLCEYYGYRLPFDMLVIDESSSFKNPAAKRFKALKKIWMTFDRTVILTGTPAPQNLLDLWPQIYLLDGGVALGKTITAYRKSFFRPEKTNGHVVYSYRIMDKASEHRIYERIGNLCMSLKAKDFLTLPPRLDNVITVQMDDKAKAIYRKMARELALAVKGEEVTAANAAALSGKLQQMANGRVYTDDQGIMDIHTGKMDKLAEIAEDNPGKPLLVFYLYRHDLSRLQEHFPEAKILKGAEELTDWNRGEIPMLLAHPASTAYGLNLQAGGNIIVWYGLTWSLEQYQQANARLYRQGQEQPVIIHHLVTKDTIDEQIMKALQSKAAGQDALLEAVKAKIYELGGDTP